MELKETVEMMTSEDYQERFKAEVYQTKIRYDRLHAVIIKCEAGTLDFEPKCSLELLKRQEKAMRDYLDCLDIRAEVERIPW